MKHSLKKTAGFRWFFWGDYRRISHVHTVTVVSPLRIVNSLGFGLRLLEHPRLTRRKRVRAL